MQTKRYHHIFDIDHCQSIVSDKIALKQFLHTLAVSIQMTIISGPILAEGIPENPGLSALAIIDYSHISVHTFTANNEALIDVFSCKPYDRKIVHDLCQTLFATAKSTINEQEVAWDDAKIL